MSDEQKCAGCGCPVYANGEGTWFGPDGELMCPACGEAQVTPDRPLNWDPERGCWSPDSEEGT